MEAARKLLKRVELGHHSALNESPAASSERSELAPLTSDDIYQYRYQYGVNLGSIFVLEKWLFSSMFDKSAQGSGELEAVKASITARGLQGTIEKWERHWSNALPTHILDFLTDTAHCNLVRLPIGYFTLGPSFCDSTPFAGEVSQVYQNAWMHVLETCNKLHSRGIGVLLDMHALPGGANKDSHSGSSTGKAELWTKHSNLALAKRAILFVAEEIAAGKVPNSVGLQLCNEAAWGAKGMYDFYTATIASISAISTTIPIYISDAWKLDDAVSWASKHNAAFSRTNLAVIDTHKYYTFSDEHRACAPHELLARIPSELAPHAAASHDSVLAHGAAPLFVGEYSCVLGEQTWARVDAGQRSALTAKLGVCQLERTHAHTGGSAFWTLRMDWMDGGGWGFVAMTKAGALRAPEMMGLTYTNVDALVAEAEGKCAEERERAVGGHCSYWDKEAPRKRFEHWRFEWGWDVGWADVLGFFAGRRMLGGGSGGADRIGYLDGWVRKRLGEIGHGEFMWEWEQGFRQGVKSAEGILLAGMKTC